MEEALHQPGRGELRELEQLREENRKRKQVVADLTLDKQVLREVPATAVAVFGGDVVNPCAVRQATPE